MRARRRAVAASGASRAGLGHSARLPRRPGIDTPLVPALVAAKDPEKGTPSSDGAICDELVLFVFEAFASVVLKFQKDLNIPDEKLNVNGGAIAMGHPLGATGAMITGTMVDELERRGARRALVTLCIGGGMGVATIIERV
jgi:acetyl-CoA C-acetyltransferase